MYLKTRLRMVGLKKGITKGSPGFNSSQSIFLKEFFIALDKKTTYLQCVLQESAESRGSMY